jgi:hypothetical protein
MRACAPHSWCTRQRYNLMSILSQRRERGRHGFVPQHQNPRYYSKINQRRYLFLVTIALGVLLNPLNSSMISVALTRLQHVFHLNFTSVSWLISTYYLASAIAQPVMGKIADTLGRKRVFLAGLVLGRRVFSHGPVCPLVWLAYRIALDSVHRQWSHISCRHGDCSAIHHPRPGTGPRLSCRVLVWCCSVWSIHRWSAHALG